MEHARKVERVVAALRRHVYAEIEDQLAKVNGLKTLISYNYYDEDAFWRTWSRPRHFEVKRRVDPEGLFRDLYAKTVTGTRSDRSRAPASPRSPAPSPSDLRRA